MADPLRRTLLAKLRGKKSKKGSSAGGGYGFAATAANGGREGKEKVFLKQRESFEAHSVVLLSGLDCTLADRMSAYENCYVDGAVEIEGCTVRNCNAVLQSELPDYEATCTTHVNTSRGGEVQSSRGPVGWHQANDELFGVSLKREMQFGGNVRETDRIHEGPYCAGQVAPPAVGFIGGSHAQKKYLVRIQRQYSAGDSIGFGDNQNHILYHTQRAEPNSGVVKPTDGHLCVPKTNGTNVCFDKDQRARGSEGIDPCFRRRHIAENMVAVNEHAHMDNYHSKNNGTLETNSITCGTQIDPNNFPDYHLAGSYTEENVLIRNIESYGSSPECSGDTRLPTLQSPTFFPKELDICEIKVASLCAREGSSLSHHSLDSEDDDYYDNEILPFYGTNANESDGDKVEMTKLVQTGVDSLTKGQSSDDSAQETDRLKSQLKEAYYLLINAMHDISLDGQQLNGSFIDHDSSSTSHSRDSLCSRLSAKHLDSESWSSIGEHSPQQVSDTDSLLLCLSGNIESYLKNRLNSKSLLNLFATEMRPILLRSASDGAIRYPDLPQICICGRDQSPEDGDVASDGAIIYPHGPSACNEVPGDQSLDTTEVTGVFEPSDFWACYDATSSDELLQDTGGEEEQGGGQLNDSSGSVNSLTGSSDNNKDGTTSAVTQSDKTQELSRAWERAATSANKGHGVTVNKMQEWMHKGRLLSSEMKQRIEGASSSSSSPSDKGRGSEKLDHWANVGASKAGGVQASSRGACGGKSSKTKSLSPSCAGTPTTKSQRNSPLSPQQSALIEHVQGPHPNGPSGGGSGGVGRANDPLLWRPPPLNSITVSKKRNWLQQSSHGKAHVTTDEPQGMLGVEEGSSGVSQQLSPPPPSPSPNHLRVPGLPSRPLRLHLPQVSVGPSRVAPHARCVDPTDENDADDEGEIWYNPIPEDDEPELHHHQRPPVTLLVPPVRQERQEPQSLPRMPSRAGEGQGGSTSTGPEVSNAGSEAPGESLESIGGGGGDGNQGNGTHSMEALPLHRQIHLTCKEEGPSAGKATDCPDLPNNAAGFSPPSSPNPVKKSSSLNWSFPDKIKSPRTVRKLSMKMKKLPELSRKLSVKGNPCASNNTGNNGSGQSDPRAHSPRINSGGGAEAVPSSSAPPRLLSASGAGGQAAASHNVISRYHLDSSVSTQHSYSKKQTSGGSKSASKGGYLSDGDSPELVAKSGKHGTTEGKGGKGKEVVPGGGGGGGGGGGERTVGGGSGSPKLHGTELDIDAFRHYSFMEQPKCSQYISGLMSLHFYGAEDLKPPRVDSRDVYCAIQVDSVNKARTALLTCRTTFLDMDHTFNIELENAQHLKLVVFSWEPTPRRNRVCCHGTVVLPALFRVTRSHQLAVKLEPRGLIYVKLSLMEQWQNSLDGGPNGDREPQLFGVEAWRVVEREATGLSVPLLIHKCIVEIEKRGCQVVGLYRLCGSAAVKKELREAFERDSYAVELCENTYPDINVITGVLKDYLRELPYPLITKQLYEAVLESMARRPLRIGPGGCENDPADTEHTVSLLDNLPEVEKVTLRKLLNHLKLVASHQEVNKMTCQNLAVCFGPVLLSQRQEASCHTNRVFIDSEELASALHFKKHIEVLHYLLQLWPVVDPYAQSSSLPAPDTQTLAPTKDDLLNAPALRRRKERPQVLNFSDADMAGMLRPKAGRLDSPSNRYAGDWSGCGESYFPSVLLMPPPSKEEADYDDVPSEDAEATEEVQEEERGVETGLDQQENEMERGQGRPPVSVPTEREPPLPGEEVTKEEEKEVEVEEEKDTEGESDASSDGSGGGGQPSEEEERVCEHILLPSPCFPKEHSYQAYMKIQDISPVLSNRVNLRDLQESIDTLIGNLERELNKNKLNVGY